MLLRFINVTLENASAAAYASAIHTHTHTHTQIVILKFLGECTHCPDPYEKQPHML